MGYFELVVFVGQNRKLGFEISGMLLLALAKCALSGSILSSAALKVISTVLVDLEERLLTPEVV